MTDRRSRINKIDDQVVISYDVAPGVHMITHAHTNCFVVEAADGLTLVDAGYPSTWLAVEACLATRGRSREEIAALVITHGHFDHAGFAARLRHELGTPVWVHAGDRHLLGHPYAYEPERPRLLAPLTHPRGLPILLSMARAGALFVPGAAADQVWEGDRSPDLPGRPRLIHVPGHTDGQSAVFLADREVIITGDALVTLDPYTGRRGPRLVSSSATHDTQQARNSLARLSELPARVVLPGHGEPWRHGIDIAVRAARAAR